MRHGRLRRTFGPETMTDWRLDDYFPRFLADLMAAEQAQSRPGSAPLWSRLRAGGADWINVDIGTDSLEQLRLAIAVAAALQFPQHGRPDRLQEMRTFAQWVAECRRVSGGDPGALAFKTSGSSGEPKMIVHDFAALAQEIDALAAIFAGVTRIVTLVPSHHIYGFLFTILLPRRLDAPVLDARGASLGGRLRPGDLIVAFPTFWQAAAEAGAAWPDRVQGVSSGAPTPSKLGAALVAKNLARLVEIYGSTETGGIGWRDDQDDGFQLLSFWSRDNDDRIVKNFGRGAQVFDLPDHVVWAGDRVLLPMRRRDGAVQVGGVNVYPDFVCAVLKTHPAVADAAVRLMRPHEGERLKAFVAPRNPASCVVSLEQELDAWLAERLTVAQRPRAFSFGPRLPVNAQGKPCDWPLSDESAASPAPPAFPRA